MPEFYITGILDPFVRQFVNPQRTGISTAHYSSQVGGEAIGNGFELLADLFTKNWLNGLMQGLVGGIAAVYAVTAPKASTRFREELTAIGWHELLRLIHLTPQDALNMQLSVFDSMKQAQAGNWLGMFGTVLKTPNEMAATYGLSVPTPPAALPINIPPYAVTTQPEEQVVGTAPAVGKYTVTG